MNLAHSFRVNAQSRPLHPAIIDANRTILHRDLDVLVRKTAAWLASKGAQRGDVIGVGLADNAEHLVSIYALAALGAIVLPMDCRWTEVEQRRVASRFHASMVLLEPAAPWSGGIPAIRRDNAWHTGVAAVPPLATLAEGEDLPFLLSLSSGTTGEVKGPLVSQLQFQRRFWPHWINMGLNAQSRYLSATPLYFGGGRTFAMSQLYCGGTVVLFPPPYEPEDLVNEIRRRDITAVFLVPTLIRRLLNLAVGPEVLLPSLRMLLSSGSPLHPEERRAIRERISPAFHETYATTEGGGVSLLTPEDQVVHGDSVGRPLFAVEIEIVDDRHQPLPPGETGILRYRSPGCATGFHGDAAATAEMFRDGWFYPGDLGAMDAEGYLFLKGRRKDLIIRGGVNIYPGEIEQVLLAHERVVEAAVIGRPAGSMGEEIVAFVTLASPLDSSDLVAWCRTRLAPYKIPRAIIAIEDMPKNSAGKILKAELARRLPG
ncbi:MAG: AMP-binding protein [Alphaproteobacteria bacterium]|nr:AMP-binding protein [Alphaproteobacteria bacterium]